LRSEFQLWLMGCALTVPAMTTARVRRSPRWLRLVTRVLVVTAVAASLELSVAALAAPPAGADPSLAQWASLRQCESGGNYTVVSANGRYYGAYQFNLSTWQTVGGTGYPNQASPAEQDYRALYLYRMRGWQPWTCAARLGLEPDADAASRVVPPLPTNIAPAWPGVIYNYGDCAPALRTWQLRMSVYGFDFDGTGCYYATTKAAVAAVQQANGLTQDGQIGPDTWRAAWEGKAPKP
jgi:resuscitation-promoting factor RpfA